MTPSMTIIRLYPRTVPVGMKSHCRPPREYHTGHPSHHELVLPTIKNFQDKSLKINGRSQTTTPLRIQQHTRPGRKTTPDTAITKLINFKQLNTLKFHKTFINKSYPSVNNYFKPVIAPDTQLDELELTTKFKNKLPYIMALQTFPKIIYIFSYIYIYI